MEKDLDVDDGDSLKKLYKMTYFMLPFWQC